MELTIDAKAFTDLLALPARAIPSRPSRPILGSLLLKAGEGSLAVTATDEVVIITTNTEVSVDRHGEICLPAKLLNDMVSRMAGVVHLNWDADISQATLTSLGSTYTISGHPGDDYPLVERAEGTTLTLDATTMAAALNFTLVTASTDEHKQILCGVHLQPAEDGLEAASTDGHRLSVFPAFLGQEGIEAFTPVTLPRKGLKGLGDHLARSKGTVTVTIHEQIVTFDMGDLVFTTRLLEGQYPEYRRLIPTNFAVETLINRQAWIAALQRIGIVARNGIIRHSWTDEGLLLEADSEGSSGRELVACEVTKGQDVPGTAKEPMAFNGEYLLDGLNALASEQVILSRNTPTSPATLTAPGSLQVYLVMPVQIRDKA